MSELPSLMVVSLMPTMDDFLRVAGGPLKLDGDDRWRLDGDLDDLAGIVAERNGVDGDTARAMIRTILDGLAAREAAHANALAATLGRAGPWPDAFRAEAAGPDGETWRDRPPLL